MSKKIGFWSVFAIVTGSQIGTSVFTSPISLAQYGIFSILGWIISGCGATALCFVFASLCSRFPKTGGPHVYTKHMFGPTAAFFTGWTYWIVSNVSTTVVVISAVGSLSPFLNNIDQAAEIGIQIFLLLIIILLNMRGIHVAGKTELVLIFLKFIPLITISLCALFYFDSKNFILSEDVSQLSNTSIMSRIILLTFFGFIGLECGTTPAEDVSNPSFTIPKAIITGTISVAILYCINSIGIMGLIPGNELAISKAPYVDAAKIIFGGNWYLLISFITFLICIGTLNAWILASGQIALGLAQDGLMPSIFGKKNLHGAPYFGILISGILITLLLILTANENLTAQMNKIIEISVICFLFVYLACSFAFIKLKILNQDRSIFSYIYVILSILFCSWIISITEIGTLIKSSLFILSGIPMYFLWYKRKQ